MLEDSIKDYLYQCVCEDEYNYSFTTDHGNKYAVRFTKFWLDLELLHPSYGDVQLYELSFERSIIRRKTLDFKVGYTIVDLTRSFIKENRFVFYSSDNPTNRDGTLFKLYRLWFQKYVQKTSYPSYKKIDKVAFYDYEFQYYFSIIFISDNFAQVGEIDLVFHNLLRDFYSGCNVKAL